MWNSFTIFKDFEKILLLNNTTSPTPYTDCGFQNVFPDMFSGEFPKPMVANFIDVAARDVSEVIAPLPAFNCDTTDAISDRARRRADKRTMIAAGYRDTCNL